MSPAAIATLNNPPSTDAVAEARSLPFTTKFTLGDTITPVQQAFLHMHGYLHFTGVANQDEVQAMIADVDSLQQRWVAEKRKVVNGIPLFVGKGAEGEPFIQRFPFTSLFCNSIHEFVHDERLQPVRGLIGENTRVGSREKDGVVFNRNMNVPGSAYPKLGWHTDGLRSLFYLRMPGPMLNVGLHFDRITREDGGLRLIPGSHHQGFVSMCFRKPYFVGHEPDPTEIAVETEPGDLTVHDGRMWHRVEQSPHTGLRSLRRSMYVPYLTDAYDPKDESSRTPFYHHLGRALRWVRGRV